MITLVAGASGCSCDDAERHQSQDRRLAPSVRSVESVLSTEQYGAEQTDQKVAVGEENRQVKKCAPRAGGDEPPVSGVTASVVSFFPRTRG